MQQETVTIILPTYEEVESLPTLLDAIAELKTNSLPNVQLIIVDDNSDDGTEALIQEKNLPWVHLIVRKNEKGPNKKHLSVGTWANLNHLSKWY